MTTYTTYTINTYAYNTIDTHLLLYNNVKT